MRDQAPSATQADFQERLRHLATERSGEDLLYASPSFRGRPAAALSARRPLFSHVAEGIEMAWVQTGVALVVTPGQIFRLTPGRLIVVDRGVHHAELPGHSGRGHRIFWCHLVQNQAILVDTKFSPARGLVSPELRLSGPTNVERFAQAICSELSTRGWGYHRAVFALLTYLSCLLTRRIRRGDIVWSHVLELPAPLGNRRTWLAIQTALEFCEKNSRKGVRRDDVVKAVGYSPSHLGHLISTHLGHSLSEHLNNLRIAEGKRLLEESELTVREIASSVGYDDPAHFTRTFARVAGLSPTAYRRQLEPA